MIMRFNDLIISRKLQLSGNEIQLRRSSWRIRLCVMPIKMCRLQTDCPLHQHVTFVAFPIK